MATVWYAAGGQMKCAAVPEFLGIENAAWRKTASDVKMTCVNIHAIRIIARNVLIMYA